MIVTLDNRCGENLPEADYVALASYVLTQEDDGSVKAQAKDALTGDTKQDGALSKGSSEAGINKTEGMKEEDVARKSDSFEMELSISLVCADEIHELNKTYRGIDAPTDVLAFENDGELLGDIIVCPQIAREHARDYSSDFSSEMELMLTHGILHLKGYNHTDDSCAEIMEARENELLQKWRSR